MASASKISFNQFVFQDKTNQRYMKRGGILMVILFILFKLLYPYPDLFTDSLYYIMIAAGDLDVFIRPIGYGKFLLAVHYLTHSDIALVALQYLLLQMSSWYLVFTVLYIFNPARWVGQVLFAFLMYNPLYLYLANLVSSDILFTISSLLWITLLLWIVYKPRPWHIIAQALVLVFVFSVRYNALYYPLVMLITLVLSRISLVWKATGLLLAVLLTGAFIRFTQLSNYRQSGLLQFSNYNGWQLANNALYMYPYIQVDSTAFQDAPSATINRMVCTYFDTSGLRENNFTPWDGSRFMVNMDGPLKYYYFGIGNNNPNKPDLWPFEHANRDFGYYGRQLIFAHPFAFFRYYVLPNTGVYLLPPLEQFERYNEGWPIVRPPGPAWFGYSTDKVSYVSMDMQYYILFLFPFFFLWLNLGLLVEGVLVLKARALRSFDALQKRCVWLLGILLFMNAAFSILASPVVFRYQVFPMVVGLVLLLLLLPVVNLLPLKSNGYVKRS